MNNYSYNIIKLKNRNKFWCNKCGEFHYSNASQFSYSAYMDDTYIHGTQSCCKSFAQSKIDYLNICGVRSTEMIMS